MRARARSPTISLRESDPATPAEPVLARQLPARAQRSAEPHRPARRAGREACGTGCCVDQGRVGSKPGPSGLLAGGSRTATQPGGGLRNPSRGRRSLRIGPGASTATVSWLPTTHTCSKRFPGLHSLLVSPTNGRPRAAATNNSFARRDVAERTIELATFPQPRLGRAQCWRRPRRAATRASGCRAAEAVRERQQGTPGDGAQSWLLSMERGSLRWPEHL